VRSAEDLGQRLSKALIAQVTRTSVATAGAGGGCC
jgi:hypothetical protein